MSEFTEHRFQIYMTIVVVVTAALLPTLISWAIDIKNFLGL